MTHLDAKTLTDVIDAHGAALVLYARQWCRAPDDAVQEALIELMKQDRAPDNIAAWLHVAVRRRAMNLARADSRRDDHHRRAGSMRDAWFQPQDNDSIELEQYLTRLPPLEREIVVARIWGELTFTQIADLVAQPLSTVHRRYRHALTELERMLQPPQPSEEADESRPSHT